MLSVLSMDSNPRLRVKRRRLNHVGITDATYSVVKKKGIFPQSESPLYTEQNSV